MENLYERYENMEKNKGKPWEIYENMDKMGGTSMNTWKNMRKNYAKFWWNIENIDTFDETSSQQLQAPSETGCFVVCGGSFHTAAPVGCLEHILGYARYAGDWFGEMTDQ